MSRSKLAILAGIAVVVALGAVLYPSARDALAVHRLVARNVTARGGAAAWERVEALRFTGTMELGQGLEAPYVLEQQRPDRSCLEYRFGGESAVQCIDGEHGWKQVPFRGIDEPVPMTEAELREAVDAADPRGLLMDYRTRGHRIELAGERHVDGHDVHVLKVTLPSGAEREVSLDAETGLEREVVSTRTVGKRTLRVHTVYEDWRPTGGLLFPRRQVTRTEGDDESHVLLVKTLEIGPKTKMMERRGIFE